MATKLVYAFGKTVAAPFSKPLETKTFPGMPPAAIIGIALACTLGPFLGVFVSSIASPSTPIAWWAVCFIGNLHVFWTLPRKFVVGPDPTGDDVSFTTYNVCNGPTTPPLKLSMIESVELVKGCCGNPAVRVTLTEAGYEQMRAQMGCCKCCAKKVFGMEVAHVAFFLGLDADFATSPA